MLYADYMQIYQSFESEQIDDEIAYMHLNTQVVADWATENGLELNINKTKVTIFGSLQYLTTLSNRVQPIAQI